VIEGGEAILLIEQLNQLTMLKTKWYILYIKAGFERKVLKALGKKKITYYAPQHYNSTAKAPKRSNSLLFQTYIFAKVDPGHYDTLRQLPGVVNLVYWLNRPVIVPDEEVETMKSFLDNYHVKSIEKSVVTFGGSIQILPCDSEGEVLDSSSDHLSLYLPTLGYSLIAEDVQSNVRVVNADTGVARRNFKVSLKGNPAMAE
jgi:hypothetical protein